MKIRLEQVHTYPQQVARNAALLKECIGAAAGDAMDLVVFPELALPGYLIGDRWDRQDFLRECDYQLNAVVTKTKIAPNTTFVLGTVITDWKHKGEDGRPRRYNGFVVVRNGKRLVNSETGLDFGLKTLLPSYREFDEPRYFFDTSQLAYERKIAVEELLAPWTIEIGDSKCQLGILICEDGWDEDYQIKPTTVLAKKGAELLLYLNCSPFTAGKYKKRDRVFGQHAKNHGLPVLYLNSLGLQNVGKTVFTFDGQSCVYEKSGKKLATLPVYSHTTCDLEFHAASKAIQLASPQGKSIEATSVEEIFGALHFGLKEFLAESNLKKVVIGVSGGIDSAVVAALVAAVIPKENILLVNLPSQFNSPRTRKIAKDLALNLGCRFVEVPIDDSVALTCKQIDPILKLSELDIENIQARDRSSRVLAALASAFGGVFTCNANKTEMTVGYTTMYGDLGGFLAPLGDLWKHQVYELGRYLNGAVYQSQVIPEDAFVIVPSAELSKAQNIEEGKGDPLVYPYHDRLFYAWMQRWNPVGPEECLQWYLDKTVNSELGLTDIDVYKLFPTAKEFISDLERWWNLFQGMGVAKRIQAPPILAVSSRAYGFDYREAQGRPFYSTRYLELKSKALAT